MRKKGKSYIRQAATIIRIRKKGHAKTLCASYRIMKPRWFETLVMVKRRLKAALDKSYE